MYMCVGCEGYVEELDSQCFCGKTASDHKGKIKGENFVKIPGQPIYGKTKVRTCPHCQWTGLVIPRLDIGCPSHGVWYKDKKIKIATTEETKTDDTKHQRSERRDNLRRRGSPHGKKSRDS